MWATPLFYQPLQKDLQEATGSSGIPIFSEVLQGISWRTGLVAKPPYPVEWEDSDSETSSNNDVLLAGWRAVCDGVSTRGSWTPQEQTMHINWLELLAVRTFLKDHHGVLVLLQLDNPTAVAYINYLGGTVLLALKQLGSLVKRCQIMVVINFIGCFQHISNCIKTSFMVSDFKVYRIKLTNNKARNSQKGSPGLCVCVCVSLSLSLSCMHACMDGCTHIYQPIIENSSWVNILAVQFTGIQQPLGSLLLCSLNEKTVYCLMTNMHIQMTCYTVESCMHTFNVYCIYCEIAVTMYYYKNSYCTHYN